MSEHLQLGTYFVVQKLKFITLRNMVKKVAVALREEPSLKTCFVDKPHLIKL